MVSEYDKLLNKYLENYEKWKQIKESNTELQKKTESDLEMRKTQLQQNDKLQKLKLRVQLLRKQNQMLHDQQIQLLLNKKKLQSEIEVKRLKIESANNKLNVANQTLSLEIKPKVVNLQKSTNFLHQKLIDNRRNLIAEFYSFYSLIPTSETTCSLLEVELPNNFKQWTGKKKIKKK